MCRAVVFAHKSSSPALLRLQTALDDQGCHGRSTIFPGSWRHRGGGGRRCPLRGSLFLYWATRVLEHSSILFLYRSMGVMDLRLLFPFQINDLYRLDNRVPTKHQSFFGQPSHDRVGRFTLLSRFLEVLIQCRVGALADPALDPDEGVLRSWHYWASARASPMRWKPRTLAWSESSSTTTGVYGKRSRSARS